VNAPGPGRQLWAGLDLLDHQIVDPDGRMAGKVDDLELDVPDDGGPPVVTTILSGLGALAGQLGGDAGRGLARIEARLTGADEGTTGQVSFRLVTRVDEHIEVAVSREELPSNRAERWARDVVVSHVPGSGDAPE
jgi:sporulation protein YlmC with PRC-barrel domain